VKVLDSDHCIAMLRGQLDVRGRVDAQEVLGVTSITVGELVHGAHRSNHAEKNLARVEVLLAAVVVLPFDELAGRHFGRLKAQLESSGNRLADLDLQIAAICLAAGATLVTHNTRHFGRVEGLQLEDWLDT
jgi:tRNA(fMet)-specific endonuclease VapC